MWGASPADLIAVLQTADFLACVAGPFSSTLTLLRTHDVLESVGSLVVGQPEQSKRLCSDVLEGFAQSREWMSMCVELAQSAGDLREQAVERLLVLGNASLASY